MIYQQLFDVERNVVFHEHINNINNSRDHIFHRYRYVLMTIHRDFGSYFYDFKIIKRVSRHMPKYFLFSFL